MGFDALFLKGLGRELSQELTGAKIEKIQQPARGAVVLTVKGERRRDLMIGGAAGAPRVYFTEAAIDKPQEPPMFCMLLRKHLIGARILEVAQPATDRVLTMRLAAPGLFGEGEERGLILELMGRTANVILTDGEGVITDCLYRVGSAEEKRAVLPGMRYRLPPMQEKADLLTMPDEAVAAAVAGFEADREADRCVVGTFLGFSPLTARELCHRAYGDVSPRVFEIREKDGGAALTRELLAARDRVNAGETVPSMVAGPDGEPLDYSWLALTQYGAGYALTEFESFSALLDAFYARKDAQDRRRQRARELLKTVKNARDRLARKLEAQRRELADTEKRDWYRECGDLITANLYAMKKGQTELAAEDFYAPEGGIRRVALDPLKTPQQNAAKYYKDYARAKSARAHLTEQIDAGEGELAYLESVLEELDRAETERDLADIRQELTEGGYLRAPAKRGQPKRQPSQPMRFRSTAGLLIRVGRNNAQNDALSLRDSAKTDLWLHASKLHGAHVVVSCEGKAPDEQTVAEAASLAALYSEGRTAAKVPVDITEIKQLKKPAGARPGMVIYHTYRTLLAAPDEALAERLRQK